MRTYPGRKVGRLHAATFELDDFFVLATVFKLARKKTMYKMTIYKNFGEKDANVVKNRVFKNFSILAVFQNCWPSKIDLAESAKVGRILAAC